MTYYAIITERNFNSKEEETVATMKVVPFGTMEDAKDYLLSRMVHKPDSEYIDGNYVKVSGSLDLGQGYTEALSMVTGFKQGKLFYIGNYRVDDRKPF